MRRTDDGRPVVGFVPSEWSDPLPCARCGTPIVRGIVNVSQEDADPPPKALCRACYDEVRVLEMPPDPEDAE